MIVSLRTPDGVINSIEGHPKEGMVIDFGDFKSAVERAIVTPWDHHFLANGDEWPARATMDDQGQVIDRCASIFFVKVRTTVENLSLLAARTIASEVSNLPGYSGLLIDVELFEGLNNSALAEYRIP